MRFDSFAFAIFIVIVLPLYWRIASVRLQNVLILVSSYVFYGWWNQTFLLLIALSTFVDFAVAKAIEASDDPARRKRLVIISAVTNLGILGIFKYFNFFIDSAVTGLQALGLEANAPLLNVLLPVGISFYTFQTLAYTIDVYRGKMKAEHDLLNFACYVAFFPQLVAGPIERASHLLPQFSVPRTVTMAQWRTGATLIVFGLVKKIAIADNMGPLVDAVYQSDPNTVSAPLVFAATCAFALQIYADFSGYTDVARGIARIMGFDLCINFDKPYVSATPSEFWRRWHISLSSWLRDYLYIALGGNRGGKLATYRNLMATMVLGGLWHGAAWNYVLWGFYHGGLLCAYRVGDVDDHLPERGPLRVAAAIPFFVLTLYGWLLFRAVSLEQVAAFTSVFFGSWSDWSVALPMLMVTAWFAIPVVVHHVLARGLRGEKWMPSNPLAWRLCLAAVVLYGVIHARASATAFIYFQF